MNETATCPTCKAPWLIVRPPIGDPFPICIECYGKVKKS